jgi:peptidoglycan hydrolase-like protein with peptidoglycan-binding domain
MSRLQATKALVLEIQRRLNAQGRAVAVDGVIGPATLNAVLDALGGPVERKPTGLARPEAFFSELHTGGLFSRGLSQSQVDGINAKLAAFGKACWPVSFAAYGLATSYHETCVRGVRTMQPVEEVGKGSARRYGVPGRNGGQVPYGRGDVQLTWDDNYDRADAELGLEGALKRDYSLALRPDISARIMVRGMEEGWFTGRKLADTLPASGAASFAQFKASRPIINGRDKDDEIAAIALKWQEALLAGRWS